MRPSEAWKLYRNLIARLVTEHHGVNPRVFGSTVRGEDTDESDLDLLIDPTNLTTLSDIVELERKLGQVLGIRVDVCTPHSLSNRIRPRVLGTARAL